jgi:CelD/BcsL family acetyltransferase involved in cellulose biosynthesis
VHATQHELSEVIAPGGLLPQAKVTVESVTTLDGVAALQPDYERLLQVVGNTLPFALHEWHLPWCQHFLNLNPRREDRPLFYVLRDLAGVCVAIIPFIVSRRRIGPLSLVYLRLLGADPVLTEIRGPIVAPGYEHLVVRAVRDSLHSRGDWDWIHWMGIRSDFTEALGKGGTIEWQPSRPYYVLDLAPTWDKFRAGLKRNIRESLRHCYNSLKRDGLQFELLVIRDPADMPQGLARFLELHDMRANLKVGVIHRNCFPTEASRRFLYAVCERLAMSGVVRLFQLRVGAQIVAARIGFVVGDSLYLYYTGYDPEWYRYSVMTTTDAEAIKYAISQGLKTVNLSPGKISAKTRWGPRELEYTSAYEARNRLRSRLARYAYVRSTSVDGVPGRLVQLLGAARRLWS